MNRFKEIFEQIFVQGAFSAVLLFFVIFAVLMAGSMKMLPITGVGTDVIVGFSKDVDGAYAQYTSENATAIAKGALRNRSLKLDKQKEFESGPGSSVRTYVYELSVGNGFSLQTFGGAHLQDNASENRKSLVEVLQAETVYFSSDPSVTFDDVGNSHQVFNSRLIFLIAGLSVLFAMLITYLVRRYVFNLPHAQTIDQFDALHDADDETNPRDYITFDDTPESDIEYGAAYTPTIHAEQEPHEPAQASPFYYDHETAGQKLGTPNDHVNHEASPVAHTSNLSEEFMDTDTQELERELELDDNLPVGAQSDDASTDEQSQSSAGTRSGLAASWGKSSVRERLNLLTGKKDVDADVPTAIPSPFLEDEADVDTNANNGVAMPMPTHNLPNTNATDDASLDTHAHDDREHDVTQSSEPAKVHDIAGVATSNRTGNMTKSSSGSAAMSGVPKNLPIVDFSADFPSEDDGNVTSKAVTSKLPTAEIPREMHYDSQAVDNVVTDDIAPAQDNYVEAKSVSTEPELSAEILTDSEDEYVEEIADTIDDLELDAIEPTDEELKERLNRLLRGEM